MAVGGALIGAGIGSVGSVAVGASMSGSAGASGSIGGAGGIPALVDQVQFLTLLGHVGGNARSGVYNEKQRREGYDSSNSSNSSIPTKDSAEIAAFRSQCCS